MIGSGAVLRRRPLWAGGCLNLTGRLRHRVTYEGPDNEGNPSRGRLCGHGVFDARDPLNTVRFAWRDAGDFSMRVFVAAGGASQPVRFYGPDRCSVVQPDSTSRDATSPGHAVVRLPDRLRDQ